MTTAAIAASAPQLAVGLQQRAGAWVLVAAAVSLLPALLVTLALAFPDGRLRGLRPFVVMVVLGVGLVTALALAATYDPATWEWCRCVANPVGAGEEPDTYLGLVQAGTIGRMSVLVTGLACLLIPWQRRRALPSLDATFAVGATAWLASDALDLLGAPVPAALALVRETALVLLPVVYAMGFAAQRPSRAHVADLLLAARGRTTVRLRTWSRAPSVTRGPRWPGGTPPATDSGPPGPSGRRTRGGRPSRRGRGAADRRRPVRPPAELDPGVRDSVAEALLLSSENRRLTAELQASLEQVRDSRARILTASDDTRRRIERDLHDGAQQLLISTGIKLNLAATEAARGDTETLARVLEDAQAELNRALTELRHLAGGIAPTALVHGSLDNALRELAMRSPVAVSVRVTGDQQPDEHTAATVYFVVAECLTNVAKHSGASRATVEVRLADPIGITVSDDGHGGAALDTPGPACAASWTASKRAGVGST